MQHLYIAHLPIMALGTDMIFIKFHGRLSFSSYTWASRMAGLRCNGEGRQCHNGFESSTPICRKRRAPTVWLIKMPAMQVSGTVEKDGSAIKDLRLKGKWDVELVADMPDGTNRRLWEKKPPAADPSRY